MKVLFFNATAAHPKVAPSLMSQAGSTLRPFNRFLGQAIHTAKQRQFRYQLPWERVRDLRSLRLEPADSLLRVPRRSPGVLLTAWPRAKAPDLNQLGFVMNRGAPVRFTAADPTEAGLRVQSELPLRADDTVIWCGITSGVAPEAAAPPPREVLTRSGQPLKLIAPPRAEPDDRHWLLQVEGVHGDCTLYMDGEEVDAEAVPAREGLRRVVDTAGRSFPVTAGLVRTDTPPAEGLLRDEDGLRYRWMVEGAGGRQGCWVQLLPPESTDAEDTLDPRAAFCEGDVRDVWTQARHRPETSFRVKKIDQDRYQLLLDRYPPEGSTLFLPVDLRNLFLQKRALRQLSEAPLPHHQGLLRLCEDPQRVRWPTVTPVSLPAGGWRALTDASRSGTDEQRRFVLKALGSPDFAFLEGPPGSGKTTAICEIVQQLVDQGQRVLLCASTHVAIDNVLERLLESASPIDAVRIGKIDKVDDKVQATQLDERVGALVHSWRSAPGLAQLGDGELEAMAERTVIMAANLTCGTTMGIVNHPLFRGRDEDLQVWERPITTMPHWDVLIVDEASKTLIQEFLVPALMAKRWMVVGDVRQLPPFADRSDIVANLRDLVNEADQPVFPPDHQRACLLLFRLLRRDVCQAGMRRLIVERPGVLEALAVELDAEPTDGLIVVRVVGKAAGRSGAVQELTVAALKAGAAAALLVAAADWVLVGDDLLAEVSAYLPSNLLLTEPLSELNGPLREADPLRTRQAWWLAQQGSLPRPYRDRDFQFRTKRAEVSTFADSEDCEQEWLKKHDLAQELAWRITRKHELRHSKNEREKKRLQEELSGLLPRATRIEEPIAEIEDIGLPSILEVLQVGIGEERANRRSALTAGMRSAGHAFDQRFESLSYQHRMHAEIAAFSREVIYEGQALRDANTISQRDATLGWDFGPFRGRRAWGQLDGREVGGVNIDEVQAMAGLLREFIAWARRKGPPARGLSKVWEVGCLCFYVKQEKAIQDMLRELTQTDARTRFALKDAPVEIVCGTVDRFQGREADLVLLSMRNTRRVGFLDSPNRLNVAVTRARQQLVVLGNANYFQKCGVSELEELTKRTPLIDEQLMQRWRRASR